MVGELLICGIQKKYFWTACSVWLYFLSEVYYFFNLSGKGKQLKIYDANGVLLYNLKLAQDQGQGPYSQLHFLRDLKTGRITPL